MHSHARRALEAGATPEQIRHALIAADEHDRFPYRRRGHQLGGGCARAMNGPPSTLFDPRGCLGRRPMR
ncbi:hypothetical protein [Pseudomonas sp. VI4.1]|uniref:hypothetical protein n=1 Tax=Pseudomonas sp. VI4.1 TaxID=1941346 RepID=UPI002115251F|nr:hypothetical protein [Pseudomonas sp. VI4.1]